MFCFILLGLLLERLPCPSHSPAFFVVLLTLVLSLSPSLSLSLSLSSSPMSKIATSSSSSSIPVIPSDVFFPVSSPPSAPSRSLPPMIVLSRLDTSPDLILQGTVVLERSETDSTWGVPVLGAGVLGAGAVGAAEEDEPREAKRAAAQTLRRLSAFTLFSSVLHLLLDFLAEGLGWIVILAALNLIIGLWISWLFHVVGKSYEPSRQNDRFSACCYYAVLFPGGLYFLGGSTLLSFRDYFAADGRGVDSSWHLVRGCAKVVWLGGYVAGFAVICSQEFCTVRGSSSRIANIRNGSA